MPRYKGSTTHVSANAQQPKDVEVGLLDPQAHSSAAPRAALKGVNNLNMLSPHFAKRNASRRLVHRYFSVNPRTRCKKSTRTNTNRHPWTMAAIFARARQSMDGSAPPRPASQAWI